MKSLRINLSGCVLVLLGLFLGVFSSASFGQSTEGVVSPRKDASSGSVDTDTELVSSRRASRIKRRLARRHGGPTRRITEEYHYGDDGVLLRVVSTETVPSRRTARIRRRLVRKHGGTIQRITHEYPPNNAYDRMRHRPAQQTKESMSASSGNKEHPIYDEQDPGVVIHEYRYVPTHQTQGYTNSPTAPNRYFERHTAAQVNPETITHYREQGKQRLREQQTQDSLNLMAWRRSLQPVPRRIVNRYYLNGPGWNGGWGGLNGWNGWGGGWGGWNGWNGGWNGWNGWNAGTGFFWSNRPWRRGRFRRGWGWGQGCW